MNPLKIAAGLIHRPTGIVGRHRPLYLLNLADRLRGPRTLAGAVGGRTVLITGASSGIGEAAALEIGRAGGEVLLVARRGERLEDLRARIAELGGVARAYPCDLADAEAADRLTVEVLARHGHVDVLVNNAGRSIRRSIDLSYDRAHDFERTMQLNYMAAVRLMLAFLPGMRERGRGQVINVSSAGVQTRVPRFSAYIASKAALDAFSECVAGEVAHDGVKITTLHMPLVRTPMIEPTAVYRQMPSISPEQAAEWVAKAIVHRPSRIGTFYSEAAAIAGTLTPAWAELARNAGYRLSPDSRPADQEAGAPSESPEAK